MKHQVFGKQLSRGVKARKALFKNLINALVEHQAIKTTEAKAKAIKGLVDKFVGMYVNERTRDMGDEGIRAIRLLFSEGARIGLVPSVDVEVVD